MSDSDGDLRETSRPWRGLPPGAVKLGIEPLPDAVRRKLILALWEDALWIVVGYAVAVAAIFGLIAAFS